jgi:hypothetical protein
LSTQLWTKNETDWLKEHLDSSPKWIYREWNKYTEFPSRSYDAIQKKLKKLLDQQKAEVNKVLVDPVIPFWKDLASTTTFVDMKEEDKKQSINVPSFTILDDFENLDLSKKDFFVQLTDWFQKTAYSTPRQVAVPVNSSKYSLGLLLSDWHFGKLTEEFNIEVAQDRVNHLVEKLLQDNSIYHLWLNKEIDEVVPLIVGDLGEGEDIFSTQNGSIECSVFQQHRYLIKSLWQLFIDLEATFKCVIRCEYVDGNHGRMSKTANEESNWDNAIENTLLEMNDLLKNPNIQMNQNFKKFKKVMIKGHPGLLNHKGTKHQGTPAMQVKTAGWIITKDIEWLASGHHHQWAVETYLGRPVIKNGSLCGSDDLAEEMAKAEPARQAWFLAKKDEPISNFGFIQWGK